MKVMKDLTGAARNAIAQMVGGNEMPLKNQVSTPAGLERNQILQEQYNLQMQILMTDQANELNRLRLVTGAGIGVTIDMKDPIDAISDQLGRDPTIAGETRAFSGCFLPNVSVWLRQSINASRQSVQTEFHN